MENITMTNVKREKIVDWYRCTTREEMVKLVNAGFDYTNFRREKYNDYNNTYFFARTDELMAYLADSTSTE